MLFGSKLNFYFHFHLSSNHPQQHLYLIYIVPSKSFQLVSLWFNYSSIYIYLPSEVPLLLLLIIIISFFYVQNEEPATDHQLLFPSTSTHYFLLEVVTYQLLNYPLPLLSSSIPSIDLPMDRGRRPDSNVKSQIIVIALGSITLLLEVILIIILIAIYLHLLLLVSIGVYQVLVALHIAQLHLDIPVIPIRHRVPSAIELL